MRYILQKGTLKDQFQIQFIGRVLLKLKLIQVAY
jgi:hypothetical protein